MVSIFGRSPEPYCAGIPRSTLATIAMRDCLAGGFDGLRSRNLPEYRHGLLLTPGEGHFVWFREFWNPPNLEFWGEEQ